MRSSRLSVSLSAGVAVIAAVFAAALIWLLLSDPLTVADAVETGEIAPLFQEIAAVIYQALLTLLDYLVGERADHLQISDPETAPARSRRDI